MLAIVIPYYKIIFFKETLNSLVNQTNKNFKVYIGDDASPEDPLNLLSSYSGKMKIIYKRFQDNLGGISLSTHWTRCVGMVEEEEWIMILGDDDVLGADVVEKWYKNYDVFYKSSNVIRFSSQIIETQSQTISKIYQHPKWESATESFYRKFRNWTRSSLSEYIFSKTSYLKYGFYAYPLAWNSDDRAWLDFSDDKPIFSINESIVKVRISSLNISGRKDNLDLKSLSILMFYKFLIKKKMGYYNQKQRLEILRSYHYKVIEYRKLTLYDRYFLFNCYLKYFHPEWILKACQKLVNNKSFG